MVCSKCGKEIEKGTKFCPGCGTEVKGVKVEKANVEVASNPGDIKTFNIISYIGILWIIGIFCGSKKNSHVRFHVGQGILVSILGVALGIVSSILTAIIYATCQQRLFGYTIGGLSGIGYFLLVLVNLATIGITAFYMVIGIMNAVKGQDKKLPIIGNLAFYK
ncbi:MAG: zinc-ribbon domain-containing protein [Clostridium sp.]|nr:zinc-ribbon domain-containing protein [Clostridium sp.]MCM1444603.1 zinc-ribbon domain-containing protein [Candidatus Amulumruptor caecigallinarius]